MVQVEKILSWRWKDGGEKKAAESVHPAGSGSTKKSAKASEREFLVKWRDRSYWHSAWVTEIQLVVFHPKIFRPYLRKTDMDAPPTFDEDGNDEVR